MRKNLILFRYYETVTKPITFKYFTGFLEWISFLSIENTFSRLQEQAKVRLQMSINPSLPNVPIITPLKVPVFIAFSGSLKQENLLGNCKNRKNRE